MEELTSGDPDDWLEADRLGADRFGADRFRAVGTTPPPGAGPVAVLDLTDDLTDELGAARPGAAPGSDPDLPVDPGGPIGAGGRLDTSRTRSTGAPRPRFATFVVTAAERLFGTAYLLTGERARAEDLLRTALATAGVTWPQRRTDPAHDVLRAMARECLGPFWWWTRTIEAAPLSGDIGSGLARLSSRQRVALVLRYHQRLTEPETAAALGAPVGNVRSWLSHALDTLAIDTRLDLRPEAGPGLSRSGLSTELAALAAADHPDVDHPDVDHPDAEGSDADGPDETGFDEAMRLEGRLADVRSRLPAARHRGRRVRTGQQIAIAAASVAAIAGGLALAGPVPDPILIDAPPESAQARGPSNRFGVDPDRFTFRTEVAGDPLLAGLVGDRGQHDLVLRFTPHVTELALSTVCHSWNDDNSPWLKVTLNGHDVSLEQCWPDSRANAEMTSRDTYPQFDRRSWAALGVRPGRQSVLRLQLTLGDDRPLPEDQILASPVRMGIAVYELSGPRVVSDGVIIKQLAEYDDLQYSLGGYRTTKLTPSRRALSLAVPSGTSPALMLVGILDTTSASSDPIRVTVDGTDASEVANGGTYTFSLPSAGPHRGTIQARPDDTGTLVLAWYQSSYEPVR